MAKAPPSKKKWYVAVIGNPPPESFRQQVSQAINQGEVVPLPDEVVSLLVTKRVEAAAERPYTEIHRKFTFSRRKGSKEKQKRQQQDKSRRRNRGK